MYGAILGDIIGSPYEFEAPQTCGACSSIVTYFLLFGKH